MFSFYYRRMLKRAWLDLPRRGAFNMHGSLLPKYRGRVPVNWAVINGETETGASFQGDAGSAARFFYTAKADADDRLGSKHPTVKPLDLMQWLCRLITPKGGLILDPFCGSGTTGAACLLIGRRFIGIENPTSPAKS